MAAFSNSTLASFAPDEDHENERPNRRHRANRRGFLRTVVSASLWGTVGGTLIGRRKPPFDADAFIDFAGQFGCNFYVRDERADGSRWVSYGLPRVEMDWIQTDRLNSAYAELNSSDANRNLLIKALIRRGQHYVV